MADEIKYNAETVKTVLNILQKEFEAEEGRNKHIESKVQVMLTVASILLTAVVFLLKTLSETCAVASSSIVLTWLIILTIIIVIYVLLNIISIKPFQRIKFEALVNSTELAKDPVDVQSRLVATYEDAIKKNTVLVDGKITSFKKGTFFLKGAIIMIVLVCCIVLWSAFGNIIRGIIYE